MAEIKHFPVGNGDMTLIRLKDKTTILVDNYVPSTDENGVKEMLLESLERDDNGKPFVDVLVATHPHQDHVGGFSDLFHTGTPESYNDKDNQKILIHELWVSPLVFKRASKSNKLVEDAKALNSEARRRIELYKKSGVGVQGDRVRVITEDEDGKTNSIAGITYDQFESVSKFNEKMIGNCRAKILGPFPTSKVEAEEEEQSTNNSSIIINFEIEGSRVLIGGDSEVAIWKLLWKAVGKKINEQDLEYDILLTPHHTSWHSLSSDSISQCKEEGREPQVDTDARNALSQLRQKGYMVSSSKAIKDDETDPPSYKAFQEYLAIKDKQGVTMKDLGNFLVTGEDKDSKKAKLICFELTPGGVGLKISNPKIDSSPINHLPSGGVRHG